MEDECWHIYPYNLSFKNANTCPLCGWLISLSNILFHARIPHGYFTSGKIQRTLHSLEIKKDKRVSKQLPCKWGSALSCKDSPAYFHAYTRTVWLQLNLSILARRYGHLFIVMSCTFVKNREFQYKTQPGKVWPVWEHSKFSNFWICLILCSLLLLNYCFFHDRQITSYFYCDCCTLQGSPVCKQLDDDNVQTTYKMYNIVCYRNRQVRKFLV